MEKHKRLVELDALRIVAAMSVVMYHYSFDGHYHLNMSPLAYPSLAPIFKYGYLGVPLFFIISGFVILMSAERATTRSFVASRFARLLPALWVCCTISFLTNKLIAGDFYPASFARYVASMTLTSSIFSLPPIDGAYWSLFVEIKFYMIIGLCIWLGQIKNIESIISAWLAVSIVNQFIGNDLIQIILATQYSPYFIGGCAIFLTWSRGPTLWRFALITVCLLLSIWIELRGIPGVEAWHNATISSVVVGVLVFSFYAIFLYLALSHKRMKRSMVLETLGAITYPLYLVHLGVGILLIRLLYGKINDHVLYWGTTVVVIAIAYAVHRAVEVPVAPWLKNKVASILKAQDSRPLVNSEGHLVAIATNETDPDQYSSRRP